MKKILFLILFLFLISLLLISCSKTQTTNPITIDASGFTTTQDGQRIAYDFYPNTGKPSIILIHMLKKDKTEWTPMAQWLQQEGYAVIVPDLRGHGQSTGNLKQFNTQDFNSMKYDIAAIKSVLENNGADATRIAIVGASIGANIAYNYAVNDKDVKTMILLSPGKDYRGIVLDEKLFTKPYLIVASKDDSYSVQTAQELRNKNKLAETMIYEDAGHGTNMLSKEDLLSTMLYWLQTYNY